MDLRFTMAHIILAVLPRMKITNAIGFRIVLLIGKITLAQSEKWWIDIPRKVTTKWYVRSNWSGSFCNAWPKNGILVQRSGKASLEKLFASPLIRKIEISSTHNRNFKYDAGQEIQPVPPKPGDISWWKILKFETCEHRIDRGCGGRKRIFNCQSPSGD